MSRLGLKINSSKKFRKIISDVTDFVIYDKSADYAVALSEDYPGGNKIENKIARSAEERTTPSGGQAACHPSAEGNFHSPTAFSSSFPSVEGRRPQTAGWSSPTVEFTKAPAVSIGENGEAGENLENNLNSENDPKKYNKYNIVRKKYIKSAKKIKNENFAEIFDSVKSREINPETEVNQDINQRENIENPDIKTKKINLADTLKRVFVLLFSVLCGSINLPFAQVLFAVNPLGIALICAADKYIFYIYSGLVISLLFQSQNLIIYFILYTVIAGVKFYLKYNRERAKAEMLSESVSYNILSRSEKARLLNLIHFNDTGSVATSVLVCAVSSCIVGFLSIAFKTENIIYTDIASVMLFSLISMLFAYLYSGLFEVGKDNKTLGRVGVCSVIFTLIYFLAPFYIYTLSTGYIASFILTLIAANSGIKNRTKNQSKKRIKEEDFEFETEVNSESKQDGENINLSPDEEIISRFAVKLIDNDGVLSDMTRGAMVGLLCGIALGDTAGAVTLGILGIVSGLFFSGSVTLAVIAGLISAASYSIYVAGPDALQLYIPNMLAGLTFYLPASVFYGSVMNKISMGKYKYNPKTSPLLDRGLLITELPANKLNSLSDAFQGLAAVFYEISEKFKTPNSGEIKAIVSACINKTCEKCANYDSCVLLEKQSINNMHKKSSEFLHRNGRLNPGGIPGAFLSDCINITEIQYKINSVYCSKAEENRDNDKTKIFADNYEKISKLLQNNIKAGKEDIAFKRDLSEKIYISLDNMGIECENVIVMGERKKTVYIFGIKMVNYSGTISDITNMLERTCGTRFDSPEYILRDDYVIMKNRSRNKFKIYSVQSSRAAGENFADERSSSLQVNGDSISVFDGRDGYCYGLISDGMGCGKNAALSSRLTVLLTEKLLSAGNQKDLTVEMLNSLLIAKNDECFASVDLFEADLITGQAAFIKAGAAPSFVVRNGKLFKIQSSTVPAGIIDSINSEQTKFEMEDGDYILMLSDGVISTFEEGAWLLEMLGSENNLSDPEALAEKILGEASRKNSRKDDMSVLFMKVAADNFA